MFEFVLSTPKKEKKKKIRFNIRLISLCKFDFYSNFSAVKFIGEPQTLRIKLTILKQ